MRLARSSKTSFHGSLAGRILLPLGFGVALAAGIYVFADGHGYKRGLAEQAKPKDEARLVVDEPSEALLNEQEEAAKGDRQGIPGLIRAIDPRSVYHAAPVVLQADASARPSSKRHSPQHVAAAMPAGVERFDRCEGACETRDPMIVRTSYPIGPAAAAEAAPAPLPVAAPVVASIGLPALPSPADLVDRTVEGTAVAFGAVKDGTTAAVDTMKSAVDNAFAFIR